MLVDSRDELDLYPGSGDEMRMKFALTKTRAHIDESETPPDFLSRLESAEGHDSDQLR